MKRFSVLASLCALLVTFSAFAAAPSLDGVKCIVQTDKPAKAERSVDHNGGKVYFCCPGCVKKFNAETASFAAKANRQLVETAQATQKACPMSGRPLNPQASAESDGVKVGFCCNNCLGKFNQSSAEEKLKLAFSPQAFEKGFEVKKGAE